MLDDGPVMVLVILFVLNGVDELTRTAFGVLAPDIADDFGVGLAGIFTVLALVAAVALGLQVPIANLADRHNRVRLAAFGGVVMAVFSTLVGFSPGLWILGITMAATGLGTTVSTGITWISPRWMSPSTSSMCARSSTSRRQSR